MCSIEIQEATLLKKRSLVRNVRYNYTTKSEAPVKCSLGNNMVVFANVFLVFDLKPCYHKHIFNKLCQHNRRRGHTMTVSYNRLWKQLKDRGMKKRDLEREAGISHYTIYKLNHGENLTTDVLGRICKVLGCTLDEIMEFVEDEE